MNLEKIAYAIWPWGTSTKEEMEWAASEITEVGFKNFESVKAAIYAYDMNLDAYKEVLKKYDLKPISFYFHLPQKEEIENFFSNLKAEMNFIAELGVKSVCLQASMGRINEDNFETEIESEFEDIMRFAKVSKEFDIMACMHPHNNTRVMVAKEIDYVMGKASENELYFAPDTAHLIAGGCDPLEYIKKYASRVRFTHLKDFKPGEDVGSVGVATAGMEVYKNFAELGKGSVDFKEVMNILDGVGYSGYHCIELDSVPVSHKESAKNNYEFIKAL